MNEGQLLATWKEDAQLFSAIAAAENRHARAPMSAHMALSGLGAHVSEVQYGGLRASA